MDVVRKNHAAELDKIKKERDESVSAFDALSKASTDTEKQLRIEVANTNTRTERLEKAIKEVTIKIIGEYPFPYYPSLYFSRLLCVEMLTGKQNTLRQVKLPSCSALNFGSNACTTPLRTSPIWG